MEIVVADTGPGIQLEEQEKIFKRYYRGSNTQDEQVAGYGIGLAICEEYAQLLGGRVWVESIPGQGASFFFAFPKVDAPEEAIAPIPMAQTVAENSPRTYSVLTAGNHQKPKILIAEDNIELSTLLYDILSEQFEVTLSANGKEAFEILQAQQDCIQLVISDIMMPIVDGFSLLEKVRSHPKLGFLPFLFLSALNSYDDKMKAIRLGVDAILTKPFDTEELKIRIWNLIKTQEMRQAFYQAEHGQLPGPTSSAKTTTRSSEAVTKPNSYDEVWMKELDSIVQENLDRFDFKITDLAHQLSISERTLRNYIKLYTGLSPMAYLHRYKLNQAHIYLQIRKYKTVAEVSYAVGFKDTKHFSRVFKKEFGKFPSEVAYGD